MKIIYTMNLSVGQRQNILTLWNQEYPEKLKYHNLSDFENYLNDLSSQKRLLLTSDTNKILGWSVVFTRDNEKRFVIIIDRSIHGLGYGRLLLNKLKEKEVKLSGWVIDHERDKKQNGEHYISPLNFYLKNDFAVISSIRLELNKISAVKIQWTK